ncbi:MAG TPA: hypothetical protein VFJ21_12630 [Mycobacteriales bacterium]|nr:hypothetical protein [Mycobacteriales bacterium]
MASGMAPRRHFLTRTTTEKLCGVLDAAEDSGVAVLNVSHIGGRDWVVVTRGPIIGPAGRRVFQPQGEE